MNEILTINNDTQTVSARELHEKLNIGTEFAKWFQRMCEYGFETNKDYSEVIVKNDENSKGGRPATDYQISIPMAKEIAMIQRSPEGKQIRGYLLKVEEAWNSPEMIMKRALEFANKAVERLKSENTALIADNTRMKPKEIFADAVTASDTSILVGELSKLIKQNGVDIGQNRLFAWMRNNNYLTKGNEPTQKSMDLKLFEVLERTVNNPDGSVRITRTTKVTGKGQIYFINKFLKREKENEVNE